MPSATALADLLTAARACETELVRIRRDLHANPELGFEERRTSGVVADKLRTLGLDPRTGIGGTGVTADLGDARAGPTVLLRADMDALPIDERSDAAYASRNGAMHACGHDGHVAMLLVAARLLVERSEQLRGRVRFLFQPAEERPPGGALAMIKDGALDGVDAAFGLHLWNPLPSGTLGITPGIVMAAHDRVRIRVTGRGGHGAMPESTRDPIVALAALVCEFQMVVSRAVSPLDSAVVTVGTVQAGSAFNVIPDEARLEGSVRSLGQGVRDIVHARVRAIAAGVAAAHEVRAEVEIEPFVPALVNHERLTLLVTDVPRGLTSEASVLLTVRTMAGEDMAFIQERVPGCFVFVGSAFTDGREVYTHHHPSFDFDEAVLPLGSALFAGTVLAMLGGRVAAPTRPAR